MNLYECALSCRTYNCLARAGIHNTDDLCKMTVGQLEGVRNLGIMSTREVINLMRSKGLEFRKDPCVECEHIDV